MRICWVVLLFIACSHVAIGQESAVQETSPASMKWYQINTSNFRVLYPEGFSEQAQRVANTLEHIREPEGASLGVTPRKISIILHSQSSNSNGFVTQAPRRSEFYAMPPQNYNFIGNNEWLTLLSSHEYRHMVQFQKSITGFNKAIYLLFGQLAQAGMAFVAIPQWFWEGDAVATETAFTHSGRGRIPEFDLVFRTNLLEGKNFNYSKQYLRSFKDNIPDHYVLGYHMVSYLRQKTGNPNVWGDITKRAWSVPFIPFTFSSAIKKETGLHVKDLYREMAADAKEKWSAQQAALDVTDYTTINKRSSRAYTVYSYPQQLANGDIVVLKSGIGDFSQLVTISPSGEEKKQFIPGPVNDAGMLTVSGDKVIWNEFRFDPRWQTRSYSIIKSYNFKARKPWVVAKQTRYGAAAISPAGDKVATIEVDDSYQNNLVVIDYNTGAVLKKIENPENNILTMPRWSSDGKSIVFMRLKSSGKTISKLDYQTGVSEDIFNSGDENVGHPVLHDNFLIFNSSISGIDNVYAIDLATNQRYQITSSKYGAYNPSISVDGKSILYNDQTGNGLDVVRTELNTSSWRPMTTVEQTPSLYADVLAEQEGNPDLMQSIPSREYTSKRYHRASGMINPHSWGPYFENSLAQARIGITSRDILSTTELNVGYTYDINEKTGVLGAGISYQGFYPIIDADVSYSKREVSTGVFGRDVIFNWTERGATAGLRIPLLLTRSKYNTSLTVGNSVGITEVSGFRNSVSDNGILISAGGGRLVPANDTLYFNFTDRASSGELLFNRLSLSFNNFLKVSRRDINPKFGQSLTFESYSTPFGGDFNGRLSMVRGTLYFPGLLKHHSLYFRAGYQYSMSDINLNTYDFRNRLFKPRGFSYPRNSEFYTISSNYTLPIWYPDINIGPLLNIQRIKTNLFFDYGQGEGLVYLYRLRPGQSTNVYFLDNASTYQSLGAEITFDINLMRFLPRFELGLRTTYATANRFNDGGAVFEFILGNIPF